MRTTLSVASTLAATLFVGTAHAQQGSAAPVTAPTTTATGADAHAQARERFTRGVQLMEQGLFPDAIAELEAARGLSNTAAVMFNLGLSYRAVGKQRKALDALREYLRMVRPGSNARNRAEAEAYLGELLAATIHLTLDVEPSTATLVLDGETLLPGSREFDWDSLAGSHTLITRAEGFDVDVQSFEVPRGARKTLTVRLRSLAPQPGRVHVESDVPDAVVLINGREQGTHTADAELSAGRHHVTVQAPGYANFERDVDVRAGETTQVRATLLAAPTVPTNQTIHPPPGRGGGGIFSSPVFWIVAGVVVVGAGVGITAAVLAPGPTGAMPGPWGRVDVF